MCASAQKYVAFATPIFGKSCSVTRSQDTNAWPRKPRPPPLVNLVVATTAVSKSLQQAPQDATLNLTTRTRSRARQRIRADDRGGLRKGHRDCPRPSKLHDRIGGAVRQRRADDPRADSRVVEEQARRAVVDVDRQRRRRVGYEDGVASVLESRERVRRPVERRRIRVRRVAGRDGDCHGLHARRV